MRAVLEVAGIVIPLGFHRKVLIVATIVRKWLCGAMTLRRRDFDLS